MEIRQRKREEEEQKKREKLLEADSNANSDRDNGDNRQYIYENHSQPLSSYDPTLPPRFLRSNSDHTNLQHKNQHHYDVVDYQYQQQYCNDNLRDPQSTQQHYHSPDSQFLRSKTAPYRSDRSTYDGFGARSAPFANAENDDTEH